MYLLQREANAPLYPTVIGAPLVVQTGGGDPVLLRETELGRLVRDAVFQDVGDMRGASNRAARLVVQVRLGVGLRGWCR